MSDEGLIALIQKLNHKCECEKFSKRTPPAECQKHPIDRWWNRIIMGENDEY